MSKLYIIANSHIDPVWIWSLSSGRSSWLNTLHSTVKIMEEYPDLKFTCSAAACFRYIEDCDPALFRKIAKLVENGRFEIVGGWEVQSDTIISRTDTLLRQGESGKAYFQQKFGVDVDIAYSVDSFGHSAGLPKILNSTGFKYYVFGRPDSGPVLFDWKCRDDSQVTALRIIGNYNFAGTITKKDFLQRIDQIAEKGLEHQTVFFGVGDHGGGLTRHHLEFLSEAAKKHELVFSTLKEYFAAVSDMPRPTVTGELGPTLRGCYSACHQIKKNIARTVKKLHCAESLGIDTKTLAPAWDITLFNHFHDILPGTSVRQAYEEDIFPSLGMAEHIASTQIDKQLSCRAAAADTSFMSEGGVQLYNPNPYPVNGVVSITGFADPNNTGSDFNTLSAEDGSTYPLQILEPPTTFGPSIDSWGNLTATVPLAPGEEKFLAYRRSAAEWDFIGFDDAEKLLSQLRLAIYRDDTHTWGFTMQTIDQLIGIMELKSIEKLTDGPVASILRCNYEFNGNFARLDICRYRNIPDLEIKLRLDWNLTHCAVKLELTPDKPFDRLFRGSAGGCVCEQLITDNKTCWQDGHRVVFAPGNGEQSFIDYCAVGDGENYAGFLVDDLHSCDAYFGKLRLTVLRPVLYADHAILCNTDSGWMDLGVSQFSIWYTCGTGEAEKLALTGRIRLNNIETREVTGHPAGDDFAHSAPDLPDLPDNIFQHSCRKTADGKWKITWENLSGKDCSVFWKNGDGITIKPWELLTLDCAEESQD